MLFIASIPIMEHAPENTTVLDGKDALLSCKAIGAPAPNTTWIFNGSIFYHKHKINFNTNSIF